MRYLITTLLIILPILSLAATKMECYSSGKLIYSGYGNDLAYDGNVLFIRDIKTNKVIVSNADCLIKTDLIK